MIGEFWCGLVRLKVGVLAGLLATTGWKGGAAHLEWMDGAGFRSAKLSSPGINRPGFTEMLSRDTGVNFTNVLRGDAHLTNAVAHNGAGLALGDVDGDELPDIYLCGLESPNRMYRNLGNWRFAPMEIGDAACGDQFSTGATFADVDGDGDLDLLVNGISAGTRLFFNDGRGGWTESKRSGLSRTASSTSMALADIDGDGDLDLYCTHFIDVMMLADPTTRFSVARKGEKWEVNKVNGESTRNPRWTNRFEASADGKVRELPEADGLYRNDGTGRFQPIQDEPGTFLDEKGDPIPAHRDWGLGVMFRDLNRDGNPDIYICNDNTSPDRIWINQGTGTFRAIEPMKIRHTSRSSMGIDVADINHDGWDDLFVVDMLARNHARRMTQLMRDRPNPVESTLESVRPQYNRNTLLLGRQEGWYVESAYFAGLAASDWSWCPIFLDVDLDGLEDLLITNGFEFDVMDQDSHNIIKDPRARHSESKLKRSMQFHPSWKTRNVAFRNQGNGRFAEVSGEWGFDHEGVSFGMATADLDNDGDLDLVVNHLNESAGLYRNNAAGSRVAVRLKGAGGNTGGTGARISLVGGSARGAQEMLCGGRYLSGDQAIRSFATVTTNSGRLGLEVQWRSGKRSRIGPIESGRIYEVDEAGPAAASKSAEKPRSPALWFTDVSDRWPMQDKGASEPDEWRRNPMLTRRPLNAAPSVGWVDLNGDGWEDLMVTAPGDSRGMGFQNNEGRSFGKLGDSRDVHSGYGPLVQWNDGRVRRLRRVLMTEGTSAGGGTNRVEVRDAVRTPGNPPFEPLVLGSAIPGAMAVVDVDGDGDLDLFVGGSAEEGRYPESEPSHVFLNQNGRLEWSESWSRGVATATLVRGAVFADLDGDRRMDLAVATEWGPVRIFVNRGDRFEDGTAAAGLAGYPGWWTGIAAGDFNGDGMMDLVCGNWGLNSEYQLFPSGRLRLEAGQWSGTPGKTEVMEFWAGENSWLPVRDRTWVARGWPGVLPMFPTHVAYAAASMGDLIRPEPGGPITREAAQFASMVFLNLGDGRFRGSPLPVEAQLSPSISVNVTDVDADGIDDIFVSQNHLATVSDMDRGDGGFGIWLRGNGDGTFLPIDPAVSGIRLFGEQSGSAVGDFNHDGRVDLAVAVAGSTVRLFQNRQEPRGIRVVLSGPAGNPDGIGSQLRLVYGAERRGPVRQVSAGSGRGCQDSMAPILGRSGNPVAIWIRWPGGREQTIPINQEQWNLRIAYPD